MNKLLINHLLLISLLFFSACKKIENGHEYVDLGLSVKWATCNIGAENPEDYGDYFAWGEVKPKKYYDWSTYKYSNGVKLIKYYNNRVYIKNSFQDYKTVLDPEDDAATANWGGAWRMPSKVEQDELRNKCKWVRTKLNGVKGYKVTGPNGNSIFLPMAGCMHEDDLLVVKSAGFFWSSSLGSEGLYDAYYVSFASGGVDWNEGGRYFGQSVRPVCP